MEFTCRYVKEATEFQADTTKNVNVKRMIALRGQQIIFIFDTGNKKKSFKIDQFNTDLIVKLLVFNKGKNV